MIAELLRAWCRWRHRGEQLRPAIVGGYRCGRCGAGFVDQVDAGAMEEMYITVPRPLLGVVPAETFRPVAFRVMRGGQTVKVARFLESGEVEEVA